MWILILFALIIPCAGLAVACYLDFWAQNCRKADEKYKKWEAEYGR